MTTLSQTPLDAEALAVAEYAADLAKSLGAYYADISVSSGRSSSAKVRLGSVEEVTQSNERMLGIRVLVGSAGQLKTAVTSTSDTSREAVQRMVESAIALARYTAPDPFVDPPDLDDEGFLPVEGAPLDLETWDPHVLHFSADEAVRLALETEALALGADTRLSNSEGAECGWGYGDSLNLNTRGHVSERRSSFISLWVTPVAEANGEKQRDYWYSSARHLSDLLSPEAIARLAAERTLRRLGARKPKSCEVPIIYESPIASRFLGSLSSAINGGSLYRDASYLCGKLGETIASPLVSIIDNPWIVRGGASRLRDGEGLYTRPLSIVNKGVLENYILDTYTARKLGMRSTRSAWRGVGSPAPGTSNFWMENGDKSLKDLISEVDEGLFITDTFGGGANTVTGDFSQGASGIWIEKGELTYPVSELTVASKLPEMWANVDGLANDRHPSRSTSAPSLRIAKMTVAGD